MNSGLVYDCGNSPLNSGYGYTCGNLPLNAGGTADHYVGQTICAPYDVTICNICGGNYATCPHTSGTKYGGTVCKVIGMSTCSVCNGDLRGCGHIPGQTYGAIICYPGTVRKCNICGGQYYSGPHVAGQPYGGTWVAGTPNTYHSHNPSCATRFTAHTHSGCASHYTHVHTSCSQGYSIHTHSGNCAFHYTTHIHTDACIEQVSTTLGDNEEYLDDLLGEINGNIITNDNTGINISYLDNNEAQTIKHIEKIKIKLVNGRMAMYVDDFSVAFAPNNISNYYAYLDTMDQSASIVVAYNEFNTITSTSTTAALCPSKDNICSIQTAGSAEMTVISATSASSGNSIYKARYGERSTNVKNIQDLLKSVGCWVSSSGTPSTEKSTGYFGKITKASLIMFQKSIMKLVDKDIYYNYADKTNLGTYAGCGSLTAQALMKFGIWPGDPNQNGLFIDSDLDLNPDVQQMISYYDDFKQMSNKAIELGIINVNLKKGLEYEWTHKVNKLRQKNSCENTDLNNSSFDLLVYDLLIGFIPVVGEWNMFETTAYFF